jgi:putative transposase
VLLRLAYLGVTNAFALLRLLPMSDRDKDVEILALRHQLTKWHPQAPATARPALDLFASTVRASSSERSHRPVSSSQRDAFLAGHHARAGQAGNTIRFIVPAR